MDAVYNGIRNGDENAIRLSLKFIYDDQRFHLERL